jgi:hypothetical protein
MLQNGVNGKAGIPKIFAALLRRSASEAYTIKNSVGGGKPGMYEFMSIDYDGQC